ncbi:hypothetical protein [Actinosynnema mirum]|uniref:hypothetical protein n=1 Tax=Actinosynnema mirum TaxID=40567 RepID=UPI00019ABFC1|nr:hypothetical protein [Actinosynnema mirum]
MAGRGAAVCALLDPGRSGGIAYAGNTSIRGALHRLGLPGGVEVAPWLLLAAGGVAVAWLAARRRGPVALLASPISWSHHWVWAAPALVVAAHAAWSPSARPAVDRSTARWVGVGLGVVFPAGPRWRLPTGDDREPGWAWWARGTCGARWRRSAGWRSAGARGWRDPVHAAATRRRSAGR